MPVIQILQYYLQNQKERLIRECLLFQISESEYLQVCSLKKDYMLQEVAMSVTMEVIFLLLSLVLIVSEYGPGFTAIFNEFSS